MQRFYQNSDSNYDMPLILSMTQLRQGGNLLEKALKSGQEVILTKNSQTLGKFIPKIEKETKRDIQKELAKIDELAGGSPGSTKGLEDIEKLEEFLEGIYD